MKKNKIFAFCIVLSMLFAMVAIPVNAEIISEGKCGDNLIWTLDDNGMLTISGTGYMNDFPMGLNKNGDACFITPWLESNSSIKAVVIEKGVTSISRGSFLECYNLISISISNSVTSIGTKAFYDCINLTDTYYGGSEEDWSGMTVESGNAPLENAERHYGQGAPVSIELTCTASVLEGNIVLQSSINKVVSVEKLHAAIYSADNRLLNYIIVPNFGEYTVVNTVFDDIAGASYAKVFLWEGISALRPLSRSVRVDIVR